MDSDKKLPSKSRGTEKKSDNFYSRVWGTPLTITTTGDEGENAFYKENPRRLLVSHFQKNVEKMVYTSSMCDVTIPETNVEQWLKIPLPILDAYSSQLLALLDSRSKPLPDPEPSTLDHLDPLLRQPLILSNNRQVKRQKIAKKESTLDYSIPPPIDESLVGLQLEGRKNKKPSPHY